MKLGKIIRIAFYTLCMAAMLTAPAFAASYVDPSVTTFAIQAVAAVVVAAGAVIGVVWRKAKKKAMKALNIDENAGKTVEDDVVVVSGDAPASEEEAAQETAPAEEKADSVQ